MIDSHRTLRRRADRAARHAESARRAFQSILDFLDGRRIDTNWERNALSAARANAATARGRIDTARAHYDSLDDSADQAENALERVHGLGMAEYDELAALLAGTSDAIDQLASIPASYEQSAAVRRSAEGLALVVQLRDNQIVPALAAAQELRQEIEVGGAAMLAAMEEALQEVDRDLAAASRRADYASMARGINRGYSGIGAMTGLDLASGAGTFVLVSPRGSIRMFRIAGSAEHSTVREAPGILRFYDPGDVAVAEDPADGATLRIEADGGYSLLETDGEIRRYDRWGRLTEVERLQGERLALSYADGALARITDEIGRALELSYRDRLLTSVTGPDERRVGFAYDENGRLILVTDPVGAETHYAYEGHRITRIQAADGSARSYHYEAFGEGFRVTSTEDELGNREHFRYAPGPLGGTTEHESYGGAVTRYHYDESFRTVLRERLDPDGRVLSRETLTYTSAGRPRLREIGGDGIERAWHLEYDAAGNLRSRRDPDGVTERWEYNSRNQIIRHRAADGRSTSFDYDGRGRLVGEYRANGGAVEYRYSGAGNVAQRRERIGGVWHTTSYEYDNLGHLTRIHHPDGGTELFAHNAYGELVEHTSVLGLTRSLARRADGRVTEVRTRSGGAVTTEELHYDSGNRVTRHIDRAGREQRFSYDARGLLIEVERERFLDDARGEGARDTSTFAYDADARLTEKRIGEVGHWRYSYDTRGLLIREHEVSTGVTSRFAYDAAGRLIHRERGIESEEAIRSAVALGAARESLTRVYVMRRAYTPGGRLRWSENGEGERTWYEYDRAGRVRAVTDPAGFRTEISHRAGSGVVETRLQEGARPTRERRDQAGRLVEVTDPLGHTWSYAYDALGRLTRAQSPDGTEVVHAYRYLDPGLERRTRDEAGYEWIERFDAEGRLLETVDPTGAGERYGWAPAGDSVVRSDEVGNRSTFAYDVEGKVIRFANGYGQEWRTEYNARGDLTARTNPAGETRRYRSDALGRPQWREDAGGNRIHFVYDAGGNLVAEVLPSGMVTRYEYDRAGRRVARVEPGGARYSFAYDSRGRLTAEIDPAGAAHSYRWEANARGLLREETDRLGNRREMHWDDAGRLQALRDFTGVTQHYARDELGRVRRVDVEDPTGSDRRDARRYAYDPRGLLTEAVGPRSAVRFAYDSRGLLVSSQDREEGLGFAYQYSAAGKRTRLHSDDGAFHVAYSYGAAGELKSLRFREGSVTLAYDAALREVSREFSGGYVERRSYNQAGRLAGVVQLSAERRGPEEILDAEAYVYDADGRRRYTIDEAGKITRFEYDASGRLSRTLYPEGSGVADAHLAQLQAAGLIPVTAAGSAVPSAGPPELHGLAAIPAADRAAIEQALGDAFPAGKSRIAYNYRVWGEAYHYDDRGNRARLDTPLGSIDFEYNAADRLTRAGAVSIRYNDAGSPVRVTSPGSVTRYAYTETQRLAELVRESSDGATLRAEYRYDALSRRRSRSVRLTAAGRSETRRTLLSYDALTLDAVHVRQSHRVDQGAQPSPKTIQRGGARSRFPQVPGVERATVSTETHFTVRLEGAAVALASSDRVTFYGTDALGSVTTLLGGSSPIVTDLEYRAFGGRRGGEASTSASYGYAGRMWDPVTETYDFGFRDYAPRMARFRTQDPVRSGANWYAYVHNDPMNRIDPLGLEAVAVRRDAPPPIPVPPQPEPLSQQALERDLGYKRAALCYATAICQGYPNITHDRAVQAMQSAQATPTTYYVEGRPQTGVVLDPETGNVNNTNHFSRILAREMGRDDYLYYDWQNSPDVATPAELATVVHDYAVETLRNTETGSTHARGIREGEVFDPFEGGIETVWPKKLT